MSRWGEKGLNCARGSLIERSIEQWFPPAPAFDFSEDDKTEKRAEDRRIGVRPPGEFERYWEKTDQGGRPGVEEGEVVEDEHVSD